MTTEQPIQTLQPTIAEWCVALAKEGRTLRAIARLLTEEGHPMTFQAVQQHLRKAGVSTRQYAHLRRKAPVPPDVAARKPIPGKDVARCASCGDPLRWPPRADGEPRFCVKKRGCRAAKMRYYYQHRPQHRERAKAYGKTPTGRARVRLAARRWVERQRAAKQEAAVDSTAAAAPVVAASA
jgi:hypothetical protein